jgi:hypothetical protein
LIAGNAEEFVRSRLRRSVRMVKTGRIRIMTIGSHLKRRIRRLSRVMFVAWLCIPLGFASFGQKATDHDPPWPVIVVFPVFGLMALLLFRTRCPRCNGPLYGLAGNIAFPFFHQRRVRYCPYFRVDFDEPMTPPTNSG